MRNTTRIRRVKPQDTAKDDSPTYSEFRTLKLTLSRNGEALQRLSYEGELIE